MKTLHLTEYADLFRDKASYEKFVRVLSDSARSDEVSMLLANGELVGAVMGVEAVRDTVQARLLKRFADQPDLLDELRQRLDYDEKDLVD